jgi:chromosome segregation ATPase
MQKNASLARTTASDASDLQTMLSEANARYEEATANVEELKSLCRQVDGAREETEDQLKKCIVALTETQEALAATEENYELVEQGLRDTRDEASQAKQQAEGACSVCVVCSGSVNMLYIYLYAYPYMYVLCVQDSAPTAPSTSES